MKLKGLTLREFNRLADRTELGEKARGMASAVLVDARNYPEVAKENNVSKQRVAAAVRRIEKEYAVSGLLGRAWINVQMEIPELLAQPLAEFLDELKICRDGEQKNAALTKATRALSIAKRSLDASPGGK